MKSRFYAVAIMLMCGSVWFAAACSGKEEPPVTVSQPAPPAQQPAAPPSDSVTPPPPAPPAPPAGAESGAQPDISPPAQAPQPNATASTPTGGTAGRAETPPSADTAQPASASAAQAIAVEDHEEAGVQVALMDVRRTSGDTVTIRLQLRNTTEKDVSNSLFFSTHLVDKMYVIDASSKKKYLVVRDSESKPVGYVGQSGTLAAKGTLPVWAKFPAPPANVGKITIMVPGAAPFEDIAIK